MPSRDLSADENSLFDAWCAERKFGREFVRDGMPHPERYLASRIRVLLLLKEPYARSGGWDLRAGLRDHLTSGRTWNNASRWARALQDVPQPPPWETVAEQTTATRRENLASVAVVNLKKLIGRSRTRPSEVHLFVAENRDYIRLQLALYRPHITLLCGTAPFLRNLYEETEMGERRVTTAGISFRCHPLLGCMLRFYHPQSSQKSAELLYRQLASAAVEATTGTMSPAGT